MSHTGSRKCKAAPGGTRQVRRRGHGGGAPSASESDVGRGRPRTVSSAGTGPAAPPAGDVGATALGRPWPRPTAPDRSDRLRRAGRDISTHGAAMGAFFLLRDRMRPPARCGATRCSPSWRAKASARRGSSRRRAARSTCTTSCSAEHDNAYSRPPDELLPFGGDVLLPRANRASRARTVPRRLRSRARSPGTTSPASSASSSPSTAPSICSPIASGCTRRTATATHRVVTQFVSRRASPRPTRLTIDCAEPLRVRVVGRHLRQSDRLRARSGRSIPRRCCAFGPTR